VVVRDLRDALSSHYVKWQPRYQVPFDVYVAGDPGDRRFRGDIWWYIHFLNRWGDLARRLPDRVRVMRYEDLLAAPGPGLAAVGDWLGLELARRSIEAAVAGSTKEAMLEHRDPDNKRIVIRLAGEQGNPVFGAKETAIFRRIVNANLRYDFGYDY
jgi:hypothetical protein